MSNRGRGTPASYDTRRARRANAPNPDNEPEEEGVLDLTRDMRQIANTLAVFSNEISSLKAEMGEVKAQLSTIDETLNQMKGLIASLNTAYTSLSKSVVQPTLGMKAGFGPRPSPLD